MAKNVSLSEKQAARRVPLADFLNARHPGELQQTARGHWQKADNHSVKVNAGIAGYKDWGSEKGGNSIDYLMEFLGYTFVDAVKALCAFSGTEDVDLPDVGTEHRPAASQPVTRAEFNLPAQMNGRFRQLYAYLTQTRRIPGEVVNDLVHRGLLYQAANGPGCYNNMVFVSPERTFYEMHGTNTAKPFHRSFGKIGNECWYFTGEAHTRPVRIYVTEAAIDAVSLYVLRREPDSCYAALGGAGKQQAVERLKTLRIPVIIATDNDAAGDDCRNRNPDCETIRPTLHDWNDDLRAGNPAP